MTPPDTKGPFETSDHPHRRRNPLTGAWVLVSPHRAKRPWAGQTEKPDLSQLPAHDPECPLCPLNVRAGGAQNPDYKGVHVFTNDFAALTPDGPTGDGRAGTVQGDDFFEVQGVSGETRVICYSEDHSKTLPELSEARVRGLIETWVEQVDALSKEYPWVQIFENKGAMMGSSQPHPHGQIWASSFVPHDVDVRGAHQRNYFERTGRTLLGDYLERELEDKTRIVVETESWVALVPFWAEWPFETMVLPKARRARLGDLTPGERDDLARALGLLTARYDNLFECSFPYSMGWHYAPFGEPGDHWQLNAVFYPPLLRSASVRKFMVGYEMLAEAQRDITPEQAAERLRAVSDVHYKKGRS
jgi:UDPglucose--hexose-1-phosphate uridylyltransferase